MHDENTAPLHEIGHRRLDGDAGAPSPRHDQLIAEARQLPREQLAELLDLLTFELHEEIDPEIEAAWADEAERRLAEIRSGRVKTIPGEQVMAELRRVTGR